jgi:hypothetical protein
VGVMGGIISQLRRDWGDFRGWVANQYGQEKF